MSIKARLSFSSNDTHTHSHHSFHHEFFNFNEGFLKYRQRRRQMVETANSFVTNVVAVAATGDEDELRSRRQPNRQRERGSRGQNLSEDNFVDRPIFSEIDFRRRYRMSRNLFNCIKTKLSNHDEYWHQRRDAAGVLGLLPEQKMIAAIRMLAYGSCADQCAEITRMGESTTLKCVKKWCEQVVEHCGKCYLRSPNASDLNRLLQRAAQRGFPGILEASIVCTVSGRIAQQLGKGHTRVVKVA